MNLNQVTLPCADISRSIAFYTGMGFELVVESAHYARFACREGGASFSLHEAAELPAAGFIVYFECADLDRRVAALQSLGYLFEYGPRDQSWLWREARLQDPDGNRLCLYFAGENRLNPPWRVRR